MPENPDTSDIKIPPFQYFWQPGSGYYEESLGRLSKPITDICEDFILSLIDSVPVPSPKGVFTIGDYGTCDGSVSLQLIHKIIGKYKDQQSWAYHLRNKHGPDLKIQVLYEDRPSSDYNSLFKTIYGETSYMTKFNNVFPMVCGTNFYKQCVPDNTCDVIVSFMAVQYLSNESYVRCSNTMFPWRSTSEEELRAHHEASSRDWQTFLLHRAAELKQGGLLFVTLPTTNLRNNTSNSRTTNISMADNTSHTLECLKDVWTNFDLAWNELHVEGIITTEEFQSCTVPIALRSVQELKAPFEDGAMSPVRQAGLNLLKGPEDFCTPCVMKTSWREKLQTDGVDDRRLFSRLLVKAMRLAIDPTLRNTLKKTRTAEEESFISEKFYECFVKHVASSDPETFQSELFLRRLAIQKLK
ncbi:gibberellic acid methyltransferase 2-like isoform X1 [Pomacea canaliculata]|uniref:gibberellic acid methyltransferase 2-like isoform X1 n=1 Tax=Pomacea canaliculata TaxID=400727 RepID=UPI000D72CEB8|nr:gibberellic acid methyltransferase 2-like isoform X1 [Pomacea canaliculata]XP_025112093.1 gibberellic acid methyltransferase 2-like isoform X1 [Pomacea canaliculata]